MFFRNRKRQPAIPNTSPSGNQLPVAPALGGLAVGDTVSLTQEKEPLYADLLRERMRQIEDQQAAFIEQAAQQGVADEQLPQLIADAMNGGVFPRVIRGITYRGSGFHVYLLHGAVDPRALRATAELGTPVERRFDYRLGFSEAVETGEYQPADDFKIEKSPRLPQMGSKPVDHAFLAKLDACIPPETPQAQ